MIFNVLTLFPDMFKGFLGESIIKKAIEKKMIEINLINIRDYTYDKHQTADDYPYGGGPGMILKPEPLFRALKQYNNSKIIYTSPQGKVYNQNLANELSNETEITLIAGRYEGIDERIIEEFVDMEVSIGDYVLTGGELPTMVIIDSISRLIPDVITNSSSFENDSFYHGLLDHPSYTRPAEYEGRKVPDVLLSGNHKKIEQWREKEALRKTYKRRPELLQKKKLTNAEIKMLEEIKNEK